ncbi:MAG: hypothetical protein WCG19_10475 [Chlorobiaceae bacterium]
MKKMTFAYVASLCMVPILFWSSESQAIPSWGRKYQTSCLMCHSGMPQRNAVGEAFKNNGYRMPSGVEEAFTRQQQVKIGNDEWKKTLAAPVESSYPQFDPLSLAFSGNLINYKVPTYTSTGAVSSKQELTLNAPNVASLFFGGSVGQSLTIFGEINGFGGATVETDKDATTTSSVDTPVSCNVRAVWQFSPGLNFAIGNSFSNVSWNGLGVGGVVNVSGVLPSPVTYAEVDFTRGETAGYSLVAGTSMAAKSTTPIVGTSNTIDDLLYLRGKYKIFGAGLLSGANGELGDPYTGLDNQITIGAGLTYAKNSITGVPDPKTQIIPTIGFTGNYTGETLVYGADIQGVYKDFQIGFAASHDRDLQLNNFKIEAGYFIYSWLYAKVAYADMANASVIKSSPYDVHQPTIAPALSAWLSPAVSLTGTYVYFTKERTANAQTGITNQNTFALAIRASF